MSNIASSTPEASISTVEDSLGLDTLENVSVRCDSCTAAAQVWFLGSSGFELAFCGHHGTEKEASLIDQSFQIVRDRRSLIR